MKRINIKLVNGKSHKLVIHLFSWVLIPFITGKFAQGKKQRVEIKAGIKESQAPTSVLIVWRKQANLRIIHWLCFDLVIGIWIDTDVAGIYPKYWDYRLHSQDMNEKKYTDLLLTGYLD